MHVFKNKNKIWIVTFIFPKYDINLGICVFSRSFTHKSHMLRIPCKNFNELNEFKNSIISFMKWTLDSKRFISILNFGLKYRVFVNVIYECLPKIKFVYFAKYFNWRVTKTRLNKTEQVTKLKLNHGRRIYLKCVVVSNFFECNLASFPKVFFTFLFLLNSF